tara:strand:+ start:952 stop:1203 length:252 start_codon:yes stop_codon:yes gene_type:complete
MTKMQEALAALESVHALDAIKRSLNAAYASGYAAGKKPRQWVGLTDTQRDDIYFCAEGGATALETWREQARAVEAKLKEKNHD